MSKYDSTALIKVLDKHGYAPQSLDGGWKQFAISLLITEKLDKLNKK